MYLCGWHVFFADNPKQKPTELWTKQYLDWGQYASIYAVASAARSCGCWVRLIIFIELRPWKAKIGSRGTAYLCDPVFAQILLLAAEVFQQVILLRILKHNVNVLFVLEIPVELQNVFVARKQNKSKIASLAELDLSARTHRQLFFVWCVRRTAYLAWYLPSLKKSKFWRLKRKETSSDAHARGGLFSRVLAFPGTYLRWLWISSSLRSSRYILCSIMSCFFITLRATTIWEYRSTASYTTWLAKLVTCAMNNQALAQLKKKKRRSEIHPRAPCLIFLSHLRCLADFLQLEKSGEIGSPSKFESENYSEFALADECKAREIV